MAPVESNRLLLKHDAPQKCRNFLQLLMAGFIISPDLKYDTAPLHFFQVMDPGIGEVTVGEDQLLTGKGLDTGSLQADILDHAIFVIDHYKISHFKGLVKKDHKVVEDIAHNI